MGSFFLLPCLLLIVTRVGTLEYRVGPVTWKWFKQFYQEKYMSGVNNSAQYKNR